MKSLRRLAMALSIALLPWAAGAEDPPTGGQEPPQGGGRGGRPQEPEIRPYERVITEDAKSDDGIFTVHRIKDNAAKPEIDAYRRNLQRAYVETLADRVNGTQAAVNDSRAFFRGELKPSTAICRPR